MGAFVLPNKEIPDQADLRGFVMPGTSINASMSWYCPGDTPCKRVGKGGRS